MKKLEKQFLQLAGNAALSFASKSLSEASTIFTCQPYLSEEVKAKLKARKL